MDFTGNQLRAARALLEMGQEALAERAGVSDNTIRNMEARGAESVGGFASTRDKVREALRALGIRFTNGDEPGVIWSKHKAKGDTKMSKSTKPHRTKAGAASARTPSRPVTSAKTAKPTSSKPKSGRY